MLRRALRAPTPTRPGHASTPAQSRVHPLRDTRAVPCAPRGGIKPERPATPHIQPPPLSLLLRCRAASLILEPCGQSEPRSFFRRVVGIVVGGIRFASPIGKRDARFRSRPRSVRRQWAIFLRLNGGTRWPAPINRARPMLRYQTTPPRPLGRGSALRADDRDRQPTWRQTTRQASRLACPLMPRSRVSPRGTPHADPMSSVTFLSQLDKMAWRIRAEPLHHKIFAWRTGRRIRRRHLGLDREHLPFALRQCLAAMPRADRRRRRRPGRRRGRRRIERPAENCRPARSPLRLIACRASPRDCRYRARAKVARHPPTAAYCRSASGDADTRPRSACARRSTMAQPVRSDRTSSPAPVHHARPNARPDSGGARQPDPRQ